MRLILRIALNALILAIIAYLIPYDSVAKTGVLVAGNHFLTYAIGGTILALLNGVLRPFLAIVGIPFQILSFGAFTLVINAIILFSLTWIILHLRVAGVAYDITGTIEFLISVAIFTILNTLLSVFRP
jgi:putative membrane protein